MSHIMNTYARMPISLARGDGAWVWDTEGKRYLDALSGIAVNTLGHNHPKLVAALQDQVTKLIHTSNIYGIPLGEQLADVLCELSGMDNVFFCNSGLEANEAAIKIARKYGYDQGNTNPQIIVYERAFHGRSLATLSATGNEKVQKGFAPLVPGFVRVPLNDMAAIEQAAAHNPNITAVFLEAIQGEGGINPARVEYLQALRKFCDAKGWLLMIDEVQCGIGRTGKWFAHQWAGVLPDVMPLAKGLGGGVPIGAVVARGAAAKVFGPGNHGTTFGGNPLAMRAGLTTLNTMREEGLLENASKMGALLRDGMHKELSGMAGVVEIRSHGLMMGIELDRPCADIAKQALAAGLLVNVTNDRVIRLLPPLIINAEQIGMVVSILGPIVRSFLQAQSEAKAA
jgi:acetylornithine/N-succinyldiaminopimelate aminotransferase